MSDLIPLTFESANPKLSVGLSWEPLEEGRASVLNEVKVQDADLSCVLLGSAFECLDIITPQDPKRELYRRQVYHSGDQTDGGSLFEDEEIQIWPAQLDPEVRGIAFLVSTKNNLFFDDMNGPHCTVMDGVLWSHFVDADLSALPRPAGIDGDEWYYAVGAALRDPANHDTWTFVPLGAYLAAYQDISTHLQEHRL